MAPDVNVWTGGKWYGPSYPDAGDLPVGRTVVNETNRVEQVLTPSQTDDFAAFATPPPRAGAGSSRAKWAAYADAMGVTYSDDDTRDDIVNACQAAGVPVDQEG